MESPQQKDSGRGGEMKGDAVDMEGQTAKEEEGAMLVTPGNPLDPFPPPTVTLKKTVLFFDPEHFEHSVSHVLLHQ